MGFGCNAAGIVGCRIIDSPRERLLAVLTNSFVPCNGRFPLFIMLSSMMFAGYPFADSTLLSAAVLTIFIIMGIGLTLLITKLLSKTLLRGETSSFTLELPPYRRPQIGKVIVRSVFDRTLFVLGRAAAVAAPAGAIIWLSANICIGRASILSVCAGFLDPFARLLGLDGVILIAFILAFPANEIVIPIILMAYMSQGTIPQLENAAQIRSIFMQNGWTAKNIESLRPYFTDALFTQMERSLQGYAQRGETNVVERIAVLDVTPLGFHQTGGEDHILLRLRTRITDYTVNDGTQQIVRGSRDQEKFMTYEWDLLRPTGTQTNAESGETKRITCPGCGAPLDVNASARCPYCGTVIQQQAQDWVISAIRAIKQQTL